MTYFAIGALILIGWLMVAAAFIGLCACAAAAIADLEARKAALKADVKDDMTAIADAVQDDAAPTPIYDQLVCETLWALPDAEVAG